MDHPIRLNLIAVETALRPQGQTRAEHSKGQVSPGVGSERVLTSLQGMLAGGVPPAASSGEMDEGDAESTSLSSEDSG